MVGGTNIPGWSLTAGDTIFLLPDGMIIRWQPAGSGQKTCF
jgi:hypothetical protein